MAKRFIARLGMAFTLITVGCAPSGDRIPQDGTAGRAAVQGGQRTAGEMTSTDEQMTTPGGVAAIGGADAQTAGRSVGDRGGDSGDLMVGGGPSQGPSAGRPGQAGRDGPGGAPNRGGAEAAAGRDSQSGGAHLDGGSAEAPPMAGTEATGGSAGQPSAGGDVAGQTTAGGDQASQPMDGGRAAPGGMPMGGDVPPGPADAVNTRENPARLSFGPDGRGEVVVDLEDPLSSVWVTFTLERATDLSIELRPDSGEVCSGDPVLLFYRGDSPAPIAQNDDDGDGVETCSAVDPRDNEAMQLVTPGQYFVELTAKQRIVGSLKRLVVSKLTQYGDDDDCFLGRQRCAPGRYCCPLDRDCASRCVAIDCGNGIQEPGEDCDDGNADAGDGCEMCRVAAIDIGQACEPFGVTECVADAFCNPGTELCTETDCGDGIVSPNEACDDGNDDNDDGCDDQCRFSGLEPGAACDPDARVPQCRVDAYCGATNQGAVCVLVECGNGRREGNEACDDGNTVDGDGCTDECQLSPTNAVHEPDSPDDPMILPLQLGGGRVVFFLDAVEVAQPADEDFFVIQTGEGEGGPARIHLDNLAATGCGRLQPGEGPSLDKPGEVSFAIYPYIDDGEGNLVVDTANPLAVDKIFRMDGRNSCASGEVNLSASSKYLIKTFSETDRAGGPFWLQVRLQPENLDAGSGCEPADGIRACLDGYCDAGAVGGPVCVSHRCGDGIVGPNEDCDDQNVDEDDGCSSLCSFRPLGIGRQCIPFDPIKTCIEGAHCNRQAVPPTCQEYRQVGESCDRLAQADACEPPNFCLINEATPGVGLCGPFASASIQDYNELEPNQLVADVNQPCASILPDRPCNDVVSNMAILGSVTEVSGDDPYDLIRFRVDQMSDVMAVIRQANGDCQAGLEVYWIKEMALLDAGLPDINALTTLLAGDGVFENSLGGGAQCPTIFKKNIDSGAYWLLVKRADGAGVGESSYRIQVVVTARRTLGQICDAKVIQNICADGLACEDLDVDGDGVCVRGQ
ncbi:MAG: DUF4215 domain-containing protein [Myxococcota bacterium]|nr:DUF4215 domain-containing protein [Myxococcota bacterium]